ncbi:hypothetical protein PAHAL_2G320200 [Panicum hallii]|uniref:Uncharacterized protein n=1 Tax=Panicum hallii TaxID=206008 RepID=A0A2T8KR35_9POAL|nr:hypothetical protein PAHAL_2G320200 [Panicum hallii]
MTYLSCLLNPRKNCLQAALSARATPLPSSSPLLERSRRPAPPPPPATPPCAALPSPATAGLPPPAALPLRATKDARGPQGGCPSRARLQGRPPPGAARKLWPPPALRCPPASSRAPSPLAAPPFRCSLMHPLEIHEKDARWRATDALMCLAWDGDGNGQRKYLHGVDAKVAGDDTMLLGLPAQGLPAAVDRASVFPVLLSRGIPARSASRPLSLPPPRLPPRP